MPGRRGPKPADERTEWLLSMPFLAMHLVPFLAFFTGVRLFDVLLCVGLYYVRMFFISAGYHRYFAHRSYKLGRFMQFVMAFGGATAAQKGGLWWAANHRLHHRYSDHDGDPHSPEDGFWWSHVLWILCKKYHNTRWDLIPEFARFPELRWLVKWHYIPPTMLGVGVFLVGGWSALFIGFFLSTVLLYHGTFLVNSVAHVVGRRRFVTTDTSRNSALVALFTFGEAWHNNHHYYQASMRNGFYWWEWDPSYYIVKAMSWVGLARDLKFAPEELLTKNRVQENWDVGMLGPDPRSVAALKEKASSVASMLIDSATPDSSPVATPAE